jgi:beta-glucanase (GH16 family)
MRRIAVLVACVAIVLGAAFSCTPPTNEGGSGGPPLPARTMLFEDNFDGNALDTSVWNTGWHGTGVTGPVQEQELACYDPNNVTVGYGALILSATDPGHTTHCPKGSGDSNPDRPYLSGAVESSGKKQFQPSAGHPIFTETRVWMDAASNGKCANWTAAWMDGQSPPSWPDHGEIDLMECLDGTAESTYHGPTGQANVGAYGSLTGWHIFAMEWTTDSITTYVDGCGPASTCAVKGKMYTNATNVVEYPEYLIFGNQLSPEGRYGGPIKVPSLFLVDYVRVYTK